MSFLRLVSAVFLLAGIILHNSSHSAPRYREFRPPPTRSDPQHVVLSIDNGTHWRAANSGLTDTVVYALGVSGRNLPAFTNSGVWRRALPEMTTSVEAEPRVPAQFVLEQNYPNPFNPTTVVSYQLPVASSVRLLVYDLLGREVATLVDENKSAGVHQVQFDASGLASGVYLYRLTAGSFVETRKLVLLR